MKLSIGDRVIAHLSPALCCVGNTGDIEGLTGVVLTVLHELRDVYGIRFDTKFDGGHNLKKRCEEGYGYWVDERLLSHLNENVTIEDLL